MGVFCLSGWCGFFFFGVCVIFEREKGIVTSILLYVNICSALLGIESKDNLLNLLVLQRLL